MSKQAVQAKAATAIVTSETPSTEATETKTEKPAKVNISKEIGKSRKEFMEAHDGNKSACMRDLASQGFERGAIAKFMDVKYQFVRNVLVQAAAKKSS